MTLFSRGAVTVGIVVLPAVQLLCLSATSMVALSCRDDAASYTIRLVNHDSLPLDSVVVVGGGAQSGFGSVPPGGEVSRTLVLERDGLVRITAQRGLQPVRVILGAYYRQGPGGQLDVVVTRGGTLSVGTPVPTTSSPRRP